MVNSFYGAASFSVFVYGTLKPGEENYTHYCHGKVTQVQPAIARGDLYDLPLGYPAVTLGDGWVQGVVLSFADAGVLAELDELEDYCCDRPSEQNEYQRSLIEGFTPDHQSIGPVWIYWMPLSRIQQIGGVLLPDGLWSRHS
jgi:gamma-glutamylcyclotransferase (GGCT)/AIG2-like uncharacterized protein YtfP